MFSLFSCGDECVLAVLDDGPEERRELARRARHADGDGETCIPNSFSEGGGARRRPNIDQVPRRSMKPGALGGVCPEEPLVEWPTFGDGSPSPLAGGSNGVFGWTVSKTGIGWLLELVNPRRIGGGRPWRIVVTKSSGNRSRSG